MKEIKVYQCETCGTQYANKGTAEWCERTHKDKHLLEMTYLYLLLADQLELKFNAENKPLEERNV